MRDALKQLAPFRALDEAALAAVERHARLLRLPAGRWLLRGGGRLSREMFLLRGTVVARRGGVAERLDAASLDGESMNGWAAGATDLSTRTAVELLSVDLGAIRASLQDAAAGRPQVAELEDWMHVLLAGPVMRWFSPGAWARVLRAGRLRAAARGTRIVARGEVSPGVFVVARGVAESAADRFAPGGFFGEESALGRVPAAEDVWMRTDGALVCFARANLVELAANYAPPRVEPAPRRLNLDAVPAECEDAAIAALGRDCVVAVRGTDAARRLMVATRLMRRGFHVV